MELGTKMTISAFIKKIFTKKIPSLPKNVEIDAKSPIPATITSSLSNVTTTLIPTVYSYATGAVNPLTFQPHYQNANNSSILIIRNATTDQEIVRLDNTGKVIWANDNIDINGAASALSKALNLSAEKSAGITYAVKQRMRDVVFEEVISIAKEKGTLTPDDLTYMHQSAKIIDKLKGGNE
jgi:hypothetical protein